MTIRDPYRGLVTAVSNTVNGVVVSAYHYNYDALGRVVSRNTDTFGYNPCSELTSAAIGTNSYAYRYDGIGNALWTTHNNVGTTYQTNPLNQYTNILRGFVPSCELNYDPDGNLTDDGTFTYTWDGENRLIAAYSGGALVISNAYDHQSRRVLKVTLNETRTFLYDGWNLIQETIATSAGITTNHYIWGKDLSGTLQGAGGVGGLLAVSVNNSYYFPLYDNNGNITAYVDDTGIIVAEYRYDAFGNTIAQSGPMADAFPHRFSTKYYDAETGFYYYGYRFYSPVLMRWMNRDPIGEEGGVNLYGFLENNALTIYDRLGLMAGRLPPRAVMVAIYMTRIDAGAEIQTDDMMRILKSMDSQLKWDIVNESLPTEKKVGKQASKMYKNKCYRHVYIVSAEISNSEGRFPLGYGHAFSAIVWAERTKQNFDSLDLVGDLDPAVSELGRDMAFYQIGGFLLAHEVLHSVGAKHYGDERFIMTRVPTWTWILRWPIVSQNTVNSVKRKLDVLP